jgi:hypothetical protein
MNLLAGHYSPEWARHRDAIELRKLQMCNIGIYVQPVFKRGEEVVTRILYHPGAGL